MHQPIIVRNLGRLSYEKALYIQKTCAALLRNKQLAPHHPNFQDARDTLLLVEHNSPVYTMGIKDSQGDILKTDKEIEQLGAKVIRTTRGGKVTWHGPGQLTGYPIVDLNHFKKDLRWYVHSLERVLQQTLKHFGIQSHTTDDVGVWIDGKRKIAAIGISVARWVTMHGFALNVNNDLSFYNHIIPCGLEGKEVTSLSKELGRDVKIGEVIPIVVESFSKVFDRPVQIEVEDAEQESCFAHQSEVLRKAERRL